MSIQSRISAAGFGALVIVVCAVSPAFAHSEFQPDNAPAATTATVNLFVENEQSDAGTVKVQLHFPDDQPITLAALPAAAGWTTTVEGGRVGGTVTDVIWSRPTAAPEDVLVPITLGPLPNNGVRLQFKVLQTYSNGDVDQWIQDWPEDAAEPEMPGPIFEVTGSTSIVSTTVTSATSSTATPTTVEQPSSSQEDDDSSAAVPIIIAAIVIAVGAGAAYLLFRRRRSP